MTDRLASVIFWVLFCGVVVYIVVVVLAGTGNLP